MSQNCVFEGKKPQISYPLFWEYKIFINAGDDAHLIAKECAINRQFKLVSSKISGNGHYKSFNLSVFVCDENERLWLFNELKKRCKFVI